MKFLLSGSVCSDLSIFLSFPFLYLSGRWSELGFTEIVRDREREEESLNDVGRERVVGVVLRESTVSTEGQKGTNVRGEGRGLQAIGQNKM